MPIRPLVTGLPVEVLDELDARLRASALADFVPLSAWLTQIGHPISKSALHAYAMRDQVRIEAGLRPAAAALAMDPIKRADQRIECLKIVAALPLCDLNVTGDDVKATAADLHRWAYEASPP